jgi:hypothetical protein
LDREQLKQPFDDWSEAMAEHYHRIRLPSTLDGCDTAGPTKARPKNAEVGHPFYDETLDALLIKTADGWKAANDHIGAVEPLPPAEPMAVDSEPIPGSDDETDIIGIDDPAAPTSDAGEPVASEVAADPLVDL